MENQGENFFDQMQKLSDDSRVTKRAHYIAAERKKKYYRLIGIGTILLNAVIATGVLDLLFPDFASSIIKAFAVLAGALAGIQTLLNFQKETEIHNSAGESYGNINRRSNLLIAEYKDGKRPLEEISSEFKSLMVEYLKFNENHKACVPANKDFDNARIEMKKSNNKLLPKAE